VEELPFTMEGFLEDEYGEREAFSLSFGKAWKESGQGSVFMKVSGSFFRERLVAGGVEEQTRAFAVNHVLRQLKGRRMVSEAGEVLRLPNWTFNSSPATADEGVRPPSGLALTLEDRNGELILWIDEAERRGPDLADGFWGANWRTIAPKPCFHIDRKGNYSDEELLMLAKRLMSHLRPQKRRRRKIQ